LNKRSIRKYEVPQLKTFSDASATGIGAILNIMFVIKFLQQIERGESSTYMELLAIKYAMESLLTSF